MRHVTRLDIARMDKPTRTPEGYLVAPIRAARVGILTYYDTTGKPFKELVPEDELFNSDSMESLALKPVAIKDHPSEMIDSTNFKKYQKGMTGEKVTKDDRFLSVTAVVQDPDAISLIEKGMQEISCGYEAELEMSPGVFEGEKYDAVQRNRRYNHVLICDRGRAGREARMRLDSEFNIIKEENTMKFKIADKEYDVPQEVADHISMLMNTNATLTVGKADAESKLAGATTQLAAVKADAEKLPVVAKELEAAKGRADAAEAKVKVLEDPKKFNDQVKARIALVDTARPMLDEETVQKLDSMSDIDIMRAAIAKTDAEIKLDGQSDEYVRAAFEVMSRGAVRKTDDGGLGKQILDARKDAAGCEPPGNGGKTQLKDQWKKKLTE